jgi:Uma2 family endonuclease
MVADPPRRFMSVEEYLELDRNSLDVRYEFIDGVVTMLAGGTADHSSVCVNVVSQLHGALRGNPCQVFNSDLRVSISTTRFVYPDISVSCDPRDQEQGNSDIVHHPRVVIEVLSSSTEAYDRGRKLGYYCVCPTLQEYMLVDSQRQAIDLYRRQTENLWTFHPFGPDDEVELKSIDIRFPLASVYEDVTFPGDGA